MKTQRSDARKDMTMSVYDCLRSIHDVPICCEVRRFFPDFFVFTIKRRDNNEQIAAKLHMSSEYIKSKLCYLFLRRSVALYDAITGREVQIYHPKILLHNLIAENLFVNIFRYLNNYPASKYIEWPLDYISVVSQFLLDIFLKKVNRLEELCMFLKRLGIPKSEYNILYRIIMDSLREHIQNVQQLLMWSDTLTTIQYALAYIGETV